MSRFTIAAMALGLPPHCRQIAATLPPYYRQLPPTKYANLPPTAAKCRHQGPLLREICTGMIWEHSSLPPNCRQTAANCRHGGTGGKIPLPLYVPYAQIGHADEVSLQRLGDWLRRRSLHSRKKRQEAESALAECRVRISVLREQWQLQVVAQTKPLPRKLLFRSMMFYTACSIIFQAARKTRANRLSTRLILLLKSAVKKQTDHVNRLRAKFLGAAEDADEEADYYQVEFDKADAARAKAEKTLREKERALGVGERQALSKMSHIQYYNARMNARATKRRLRDRLRQRKFELDLVERSFRRLMNEQKYTEAAVKRREKGIHNLATEYNKQCAKVAQLIRDKNAPRGALAPRSIPDGQLWKLDVDDEIWEDVGLDDDETEQQTTPPP
ncbi:hypothetical protein B0H19DRAFT_1335642 [Mycena capillaripes]|nr:hypothetical protein B0H19DRAFT_1335642 [Mycena capillaripes]